MSAPFRSFADAPCYQLLRLLDLMERFEPQFLRRLLGWYALSSERNAFPDFMKRALGDEVALQIPHDWQMVSDEAFSPQDLLNIANEFENNGFGFSAELLRDVAYKKGVPPLTLSNALVELKRRIQHELRRVVLMRIPSDRASFYDQPTLFGEQVNREFPSVMDEIAEAGKCLAVGRSTACVFHLMRIVEAGLDSFMEYLTGAKRYYPTWDAIFKEIGKKLDELEPQRGDLAVREMIRFASEVRLHTRAVRDAWRNATMHKLAKTYNEQEAKVVFDSVKTFMQFLAGKLKEVKPPEQR